MKQLELPFCKLTYPLPDNIGINHSYLGWYVVCAIKYEHIYLRKDGQWLKCGLNEYTSSPAWNGYFATEDDAKEALYRAGNPSPESCSPDASDIMSAQLAYYPTKEAAKKTLAKFGPPSKIFQCKKFAGRLK